MTSNTGCSQSQKSSYFFNRSLRLRLRRAWHGMGIPALNQPVLHSFRMKRLAFSAFLLPLFLTAQQVPVGSGVPAPVQASASYQGKRGVQPIYYWVCTRFPSGYACMSQPAIASGTEGIGNLGGGNSVNLNWSAVVSGATGYDVIRQSSGGSFSGSCNNGCAIALNIHTTSYSDSSPSAGSNYPPAGLTPVMAAAGRIVLDNLDYATPTLVWVLAGITEPFCFPGSSGCGSSLGITALVGDVAAVGPGVATATVQGIEGVPFCTGYTPTNGEFVEYTTGGSPSPCYSAASASAGGITQLTGDATAGPGSGSQALTLATVNTGPGTCGDATHVCQITTNGKGQTTAQTAIGITAGTITGSGTVNDLPKWTGSTALGNSGVSDDGTTVSTAELWAAAQNTSTGDTDAGGNLNVTGNGNFGTGSGAAGSVGWCDTGCVHEQVWDGDRQATTARIPCRRVRPHLGKFSPALRHRAQTVRLDGARLVAARQTRTYVRLSRTSAISPAPLRRFRPRLNPARWCRFRARSMASTWWATLRAA